MWLYYVGGAALLGGAGIAYSASKKKDDSSPVAQAKAAQAAAAASSAPAAAPAVPFQAAPIQPPYHSQPPGIVNLPAPPPMTPALQAATQNLITYLATGTPGKGSMPQVKAFQSAYNGSGPTTPLASDGKYGPKTQAALQAVIAPAPVPGHFMPTSRAVAAPPPIPAAKPIAGIDVTGAAIVLANMSGAMPKSSDARVSTFQAAYNATPGITHIVADGKYGGSTQGALESVLNWMGTGLVAPPNSFGLAIQRPKQPYSSIVQTPAMVPVAAGGLDALAKNTAMPGAGSQIATAIGQTVTGSWTDYQKVLGY